MGITAKEAATLTGLSKQAIIKSINMGKISAVKDVDGSWQIEPVELFRHYPPLSTVDGNARQEVDERVQPVDGPSVEALQVEVKLLRELLAAKDDTIADLRHRLDDMTSLVTPQPPRSWWSRLLGKG